MLEIDWILQVMNYYSNADLPTLYNAGASAACSGGACRIADAINVIPQESPGNCDRAADHCNLGAGVLVRLENESCTGPYNHYPPASAYTGANTLAGLLFHEIGHALGLAHSHGPCDGPLLCEEGPCSAMDWDAGFPTAEIHSWYLDDTHGLRSIYGNANHPNRVLKESGNGINWFDLGTSGMPNFQPLFSLSSSGPGTTMFATHRDPAQMHPRTSTWDWAPIVWTDWGRSDTYETQGYTGAGWNPATGFGYNFWLGDETNEQVVKSFRIAEHTGASSRTVASWSGETTRRHGISGAHDPNSGARVQVWRTDTGEIRIQVVSGSGTFIDPFIVKDGAGNEVRAFDTPSVACGDPNILRNCIIAWPHTAAPDTGAQYHFLQWMHFNVSFVGLTWVLDAGPIMTDGIVMFSSPVVSYRGPSTATHPYVVAFVQRPDESLSNEFITWTIAKSSTENALWDPATLASHGLYTDRMAAALGSANSFSELVLVRR